MPAQFRNAPVTMAPVAIALTALVLTAFVRQPRISRADPAFTSEFGVEPGELGPTGRNPWFVLEPGYRLVLAHASDTLAITVLDSIVRIDGIDTRVVEERESHGTALVEVSRNFFAISRRTNSVFYFGEDVDIYHNGAITAHEGAWRAGVQGAHFGLAMPGLPLLGARFQQEMAPGVAMDRGEVASLSATLTLPAGAFTSLLRINETTPLEPGNHEYKLYARGIGLVQDDDLTLVRHGTNVKPR